MVPVLETKRLFLRGHRKTDFSESASMWADARVVAHISGVPSTPEQSWSRLLRYAGHWHHLGFGYWVVTAKADGSFLGEVGLADYNRDVEASFKGKPKAGWVFNTRSQGNGFASEATATMLEWADQNLNFTHTIAIFDPTHAASIKVATKVGYSNGVLGRFGAEQALFMERERLMGVHAASPEA